MMSNNQIVRWENQGVTGKVTALRPVVGNDNKNHSANSMLS